MHGWAGASRWARPEETKERIAQFNTQLPKLAWRPRPGPTGVVGAVDWVGDVGRVARTLGRTYAGGARIVVKSTLQCW